MTADILTAIYYTKTHTKKAIYVHLTEEDLFGVL